MQLLVKIQEIRTLLHVINCLILTLFLQVTFPTKSTASKVSVSANILKVIMRHKSRASDRQLSNLVQHLVETMFIIDNVFGLQIL